MLATVQEPRTEVRLAAYADLFGCEPLQVFPHSDFSRPDDDLRIDVLFYPMSDHVAMVTDGLSDQGRPRREFIQYIPYGRRADAHRLHSTAYSLAVIERSADFGDSITLPYPSGSAWPHAVFLPPPVRAHSDFEMTVDGNPMRFLWHVPLASSEFGYQLQYGIPALLRCMSNFGVPWVFDEATRPVLR